MRQTSDVRAAGCMNSRMAAKPCALADAGYLPAALAGRTSTTSTEAGSAYAERGETEGRGRADAALIEARSAALETEDEAEAEAIDTAASSAAAGDRVCPPLFVEASVSADTVAAVEGA